MQLEHVYIQTQIENLRAQIDSSSISSGQKEMLLSRLENLHISQLKTLCESCDLTITPTNFRYLLLFLLNTRAEDIAAIFHVETASVYTVRYRIRKQFPKTSILPF